MEGKLIKRSTGRYDLYHINDEKEINTIASSFGNPNGKLSLKNCEAIENGYDLDELAENHALEVYDKVEADEDYQDYANFNNRRNNFKDGFQKALEILGDSGTTSSGTSSSGTSSKKFNTEFILNLVPIVLEKHKSLNITEFNDWYNSDFLKMLFDKKEWIVEIEMEIPPATYGHSGWHEQPKLDSNGCLIIKPVI